MTPFEIFVTCISWGSSGKNRPVLVLLLSGDNVFVYPITTQYENKSEVIRMRYFKINDLEQAGLVKQSYIDTGMLIKLPLSVIANKEAIGQLSLADKLRLLEFLSK